MTGIDFVLSPIQYITGHFSFTICHAFHSNIFARIIFFFILNFISFIIFGVCLGVSSCDNIKKGLLPRCQLWKTILKIYVIILIFFLSRKKTAMNSTKHCIRNILMATSNKSLLHLVESKNVYIGKEQ